MDRSVLKGLMAFKKGSIDELRELSASDPNGCFEIGWEYITTIPILASHVSAGFIDGALVAMQQALGASYTERRLLDAWSRLDEECRGEICYSGIANPAALSNEFWEGLFFSPVSSIPDRRVILATLASTLKKRGFPPSHLARMLQVLELHEAENPDAELADFIRHIKKFL